jgi:hypothetical protein
MPDGKNLFLLLRRSPLSLPQPGYFHFYYNSLSYIGIIGEPLLPEIAQARKTLSAN